MKRKLTALLALALASASSFAQQDLRTVENINYGWLFKEGDTPDAAKADFDAAMWRKVNLPHDFQIEQPWVEPDPSERPDNSDAGANVRSRLSSRGFKEMGKGWYRLHFTPSADMKGKRVVIDFEGIMYVGDVYLNGELVGKTDYGYVGFEVDVTKKVKFGEENIISVMADTREPNNSRWYTGGGLFRDVNVVYTDAKAYFTRHPLYITTKDNREVNIQVESAFYDGNPDSLTFGVRILGPDGSVVCDRKERVRRNPKLRVQELTLPSISVADAKLWDCENPNLYTAEVTLFRNDGSAADCVSERFGIRTIEFGPEFGFKLNGKKVLLKGIANHHTLGALGAAVYPRAMEKRLRLLKEFGLNHVRTSHNPYSASFLNLCDELGIIVVDELYDKWLDQYCGGRAPWATLWQNDVPEFIKRDRNHPSVVLWSLGNELQTYTNLPFGDWGVTPFRLQKTLLQKYDTTRLVTVAMHPRGRNHFTDSLPAPLAMVTDIQAYNYRYMYFPGDGKNFPWMTFYQSEASVAAMGLNYFEMNLDKVIGLAYWGLIDYLGESQGWPAKGWAQGVFDISLEAKPKAYYLKSFCSDEPMVHIAIVDKKGDMMWNGVQTGNDGMSSHWNYKDGSKLNMITYTNAEEVELFVNGKSVGVKKNDLKNSKMRNQIRWDGVDFAAGNCEAVARTAGKVVARHKLETAGAPAKLALEADNADWKADGMDLQHIRVVAVDKKGRRAVMAQEDVTFEVVSGDATLIAVSSGDHNGDELNVVNHRKLYNGSCLGIFRAGRTAGPVVLKVSAPGYKPQTLKLATK